MNRLKPTAFLLSLGIHFFIQSVLAASLDGLQTRNMNNGRFVQLGAGFNLLDGNFTGGNALGRSTEPDRFITKNVGSVEYYFRTFDSIRAMSSELSVSGDASYGGFGSAEFSTARSSSYNSFSTIGVLRLRYLARTETLKEEAKSLSRQALSRITNINVPKRFTESYGDACVVERHQGGILSFWFKAQAKSLESASKNKAHMEAGLGVFEGGVDYKKASEQLKKVSGLEIRGYQFGAGNDGRLVVTNLADMISMLEEFPKRVRNAMESDSSWDNTIGFALVPYVSFSNYPDEVPTVTRDVDSDFLTLSELDRAMIACKLAVSDLMFADANPSYYDKYSKEISYEKQERLHQRIDWLERAKLIVHNNETFDRNAPELVEPVDSSVDVFGGYRIIEVPLRFKTKDLTGFMKHKGKGDEDVHTKDDRETYVFLKSDCGVEDYKRPFIDFTMGVTEKAKDKTKFVGTKRVYLDVPPEYRKFKILEPGPNAELDYADTYRTERNGFFEATKYLKNEKRSSFVEKMSLCIDTTAEEDGPSLGFKVEGWATFRMLPNE